jgi:formylglycine-generating enzyme required for sulfatase activity
MKTITFFVLSLLFLACLPCFGLNYTITFTYSGASTTVGDVLVQNLTRGISVTVPEGNVLNLYDVSTAVEQFSADDETIRVYPASVAGKSLVSFFARQAGVTQVNVYSIDGRKVAGTSTNLQAGSNTFKLSLPKGVFVIQVIGNEYAYTAKLLNQTGTQGKPGIVYTGIEKPVSSGPQKISSSTLGVTTMSYTAGDQLLYTDTSGAYIASVPDVPTCSKTTNFVFCTLPTSAIPAGTFTMGSPTTEENHGTDETQHQVTLSAFIMSKYEITNAQYAAFLNAKSIGSNGIWASAPVYNTQTLIYASGSYDFGLHYSGSQWVPVAGYESSPVINVTWYGSTEFATYMGGTLPTEAQWEYACRAGTTTPFSTGSCLTNTDANYLWSNPYSTCTNTVNTPLSKTQPVGSYAPNAYGLYDMHGNVWEWCSDWYDTYPTSAQSNPTGATTGSYRVLRGGSWSYMPLYCRSAFRFSHDPSYYIGSIGFRVVFVP